MPEDKKAVNEFLKGLGQEEKDPFQSEDPFAPKEEEGTVAEEDKRQEKALPFHRDPKVLKFVEKQVAKALEGVKATPTETRQIQEAVSEDAEDLVAAFTEIIGNDTPEKLRALKALEKTLKGVDEKAAQKAIERFQQQTQDERVRQTQEEEKAQQELDDSFEEIEETYNVDLSSNTPQARKTRSDFVEYIRKIAPKNSEGEVVAFPDLPSAFEEFQERQKRVAPSANRAKTLAARGMERSNDASTAPALTDKSWKGVEKFINNLSS